MTTIDCLSPFLLVSIVDRARIRIEPRPVGYACTVPWRPTMKPPVGKSGRRDQSMSSLQFFAACHRPCRSDPARPSSATPAHLLARSARCSRR